MTKPRYGTIEYYSQYFSDILADCGTGNYEDDIETLSKLLYAFEDAITNWLDYHEHSAGVYRLAWQRFLAIERSNET